ncbi:MAG: ABC transporter permease subunit [Opitutus sp.]
MNKPSEKSSVRFCFRRVLLIAENTVCEAIRQRALVVTFLLVLCWVLSARGLRVLDFGATELKFIVDFGFGSIGFFGAVLTVTAMSQLFHREIELRTALTLLAKPMSRAEFLLGKLLGVVSVSGGFCAMLTVALLLTLWARQNAMLRESSEPLGLGHSLKYFALIAAGFAQWLKFAVLAALTLFIASFARSQLFSTTAGFLVLMIGHLQFIAQASVERASQGFVGRVISLLPRALPDFQSYDLSSHIEAGAAVIGPMLIRLVMYTMAYVGLIFVLTVSAFRRREI